MRAPVRCGVLAAMMPRLLPPAVRLKPDTTEKREIAILEMLRERGASFFGPLHDAVGGGYPAETVDALYLPVYTCTSCTPSIGGVTLMYAFCGSRLKVPSMKTLFAWFANPSGS